MIHEATRKNTKGGLILKIPLDARARYGYPIAVRLLVFQ
jgi:hypothetical protein